MKWFKRLLVPITMVGMLVLSGCAGSVADYLSNPSHMTSGPNALVGPTSSSTLGSTSGVTSVPTLGSSFKQGEKIPADKAVVYIYRPNPPVSAGDWFFGSGGAADVGISFDVKTNGKVVTTLVKGGYYAYLTEPGEIEFTACEHNPGFFGPKSTFSITLDAKAGQAYYLKGAHGKGGAGRAHLELVSPEVGAQEIANCKLIP